MEQAEQITNVFPESIAQPRKDKMEVATRPSSLPTILVASVDQELCSSIRELLAPYPVKIVYAQTVKAVKSAISAGTVAACICGFWMVDGTYRDVVRHLREEPLKIPTVIVCAPECPADYKDYLAAINLQAFEFISHLNHKDELLRILQPTINWKKSAAA